MTKTKEEIKVPTTWTVLAHAVLNGSTEQIQADAAKALAEKVLEGKR